MDKYEYKIRAEEIKNLVASKKYEEAMEIADSVDWRRVKSIMMLTIVSDIYKVNRRYEDSKEVLLLAYERHSGGRTIVYSLCELSIKMEEFVQAWEYYKEFVQIAPKDTGRYILQYKLYEAQEVSIEERIAVLEEFKKRDYREKWAYELAYLYHRIGLSTKCVEECDELILWFGEGKYVLKAMELKMLHAPLNSVQQDKYDQLTGNKEATSVHRVSTQDMQAQEDEFENVSEEFQEPDMDIQVKTMDMSKYNTINLQQELAASMKELLADEAPHHEPVEEIQGEEEFWESQEEAEDTIEDGVEELEDIQEDMDISEEEDETDAITSAIVAPLLQETVKLPEPEEIENEIQKPFQQEIQEVFFEEGQTDALPEVEELEEIRDDKKIIPFEVEKILAEKAAENQHQPEESQEELMLDNTQTGIHRKTQEELEYERMVAQESDGQISLVIPEEEHLEKQITGQISIQDILAEWENTKKRNQEKRMEDVRKRVSEQTGQLFSEFDESTKTDLLAKLEAASKLEEENRRLREANVQMEATVKAEDTESNIDTEAVEETEDPEQPEVEETREETEDTTESISEKEMEEAAGEEENLPEAGVVESEEPASETVSTKDTHQEQEKKPDSEAEKENLQEREEEFSDTDEKTRELTEEEDQLFGSILHSKKAKRQLAQALDMVTLASYTGNILITGEEGTGTLDLATILMKEIQKMDNNFSGKVAKISAKTLNSKNPAKLLPKLENGALIIEKAGILSKDTLDKLVKVLDQGTKGIIVLMEDTSQNIDKLIQKNQQIAKVFNARIDVPQLNNDALVNYAKQYAMEQEFSIDELGILALYTRIAEMQTSDHVVNIEDVEDIMEDAMYSATKKNLSHLKDVLFGKRYDEEDMIILREKDFINY